MKKKLIITGHDLGLSKSINDGYEYAIKKLPKSFSELSILPNSKYSADAVKIAKDSGISTNLSFSFINHNLFSLSNSPSLTDSTNHLKNVTNFKTWDFSVIDTFTDSDIENEIAAQYQWFLDNFGHKPSALVTQKGEHGDPKILEPLINLAKSENLPMRAPLWKWQTNYGAQSLVESEGIKTTSQFPVCFKDWQNGSGYDLETDIDKIINKINETDGVSEIALLAGFCDQELFDMSSVSWQRGQILNIIKRKYFLIERLYSEFDVITYTDLLHM